MSSENSGRHQVEVGEFDVRTFDKNTYRVSGLDPKGKGSGFKINLSTPFAETLQSISAPNRQAGAIESLTQMYLDHRNSHVRFKGDSFLLTNITVAFEATGLDLTEKNETDFVYHTHNVDTATEALEILAVFTKWVEFGHVVITGEQPRDPGETGTKNE